MPLAPVVLADLGVLSTLPLELVIMVVEYLDVRSAARFTRVNRQAQFLLWSDKGYQLLRYCLFKKLSEHKRKFHKSNRLPFLQDANYRTLADAMLNPACITCGRVSYALDLRLDIRTGQTFCWPCLPGDLAYILVSADYVEMDRKEVKNTIPYRLPEGQLIFSRPSNAEYLTNCFSQFRKKGREIALRYTSRDAWDYWIRQQKVLICAPHTTGRLNGSEFCCFYLVIICFISKIS